jgi:hypothetical protein
MNSESPSAGPDPATAIRPFVDGALDAGQDRRGNRAVRGDGWTPDRIRTFLETLADTGCVTHAARSADISVRSAYNLRNRAEGRAFHLGWEAALQLARRRLADNLMARAMHGCVDQIRKDGEVVAERCRFDNRLSMATLTRLDQRAAATDAEAEAIRIVTDGFDEFLDLACCGGDGAAFVDARRPARTAENEGDNPDAAKVQCPTIDISDLDPELRDIWTEDQVDRARRAGILDLDDWYHPAARHRWPTRIPESLGPKIATGWCRPLTGDNGTKWVIWETLIKAPPEESNGNDELHEL